MTRTVQLAGLLDLAYATDGEVLHALIEAGEPDEDVVLSPEGEAAYQRQAARFNAMRALRDPARQLPVLTPRQTRGRTS